MSIWKYFDLRFGIYITDSLEFSNCKFYVNLVVIWYSIFYMYVYTSLVYTIVLIITEIHTSMYINK